jgi:glutamate---cysteine ligase / carboxylate-amine ligase
VLAPSAVIAGPLRIAAAAGWRIGQMAQAPVDWPWRNAESLVGMNGGAIGDAFGSGDPFTVGVEEELFLVDPVSGAQANASEAVQSRLAAFDGGRIERELHACQVELITDVCRGAGDAVRALAAMRGAVLSTGAGLLGTGTHPSALEGEAEITDKARYERIHDLLGDAAATPVAGLHVHVGMPDRETAITVFNGLRRHLPLLFALGANSPFRHGRDTGLASAREVTLRSWPRSGVPRAMRDFADFAASARVLARAADVPDYTWFWWKLRPHPRLGTVEIRALDAQTELADTASLVALVQCLARDCAEHGGGPDPPVDLVDEGIFRAARFGTQALLPDTEGNLKPVADLLGRALERAAPYASELDCSEPLDALAALMAACGGAGRQRALHDIAGMAALLRGLAERTAGQSPPPGPRSP